MKITDINIKDFAIKSTLPYAHYTIMDRALISDDGLKPVQRRILYHMYKVGAKNGKMVKAATLASGVIGVLHPHGDSSVGAALARIGQPFAMRIPLIKAMGSLGLVTGDKAASPRYFEACLSDAGEELVQDLAYKVTKMKDTFTGVDKEPIVLPISFPVGLINGTQGVAVGFASNIPPHNPNEVMDCVKAYIKGKIKKPKDALKYIKGADFPTGGTIVNLEDHNNYLLDGKGAITVIGKYRVEKDKRREVIIFYELPYQVSPENVKTAIIKAKEKGSLDFISDVTDLSGMKDGLKVAIYLKTGIKAKDVIDTIFENTPCKNTFNANMVVLLDGVPKTVNILELIQQFTTLKSDTFRKIIVSKLQALKRKKMELLAIISVIVDIDGAIKIIRNSKDETEATKSLMKKFKLEQDQAEYILGLQLRTLTKQNKVKLDNDLQTTEKEEKELELINTDDKQFETALLKEIDRVKKVIYSERRTTLN